MNIRFVLTSLFFAGGVFFFVLAANNLWGSRTGIPLDEATSIPNSQVDLQSLTARPLVDDSMLYLRGVDVLSLVVLPANYDCDVCSQRARLFVEALRSHPSFESLSTKTSAVIVELNHRIATHFAHVQQFEVPVFQTTTALAKGGPEKSGLCSALLVDPQTETVFLRFASLGHVSSKRVTPSFRPPVRRTGSGYTSVS